jgi:mannose/cellobiose epimerase-like protein (N-acyl-D-glucosamine 2-epimerase family)
MKLLEMRKPIDFRSAEFLRQHVLDTMAFYDRTSRDPSGGFFHFFKDDGTVYDRTTRHLVSSARFVFNNAAAFRRFGKPQWQDAARHGLRFLREVHRDPSSGRYAWLLRWDDGERAVLDATEHCYGLAFVLLAHAHALMAGIDEARAGLAETFERMEHRFWEPAHGLYADEASPEGVLSPYRGQNANMHACEALIAAFDATSDAAYLERAETLAHNVTRRVAERTGGLIWEHYQADWSPDWDYNRHDRSNIFRPWGYQTGHLAEWAKLLLVLDRRREADWRLRRARELFAAATEHGWDNSHGGLAYAFSHDAVHRKWPVCDNDKYFWVQAETIGASALLAVRTGEGGYWDWYDRIWEYCWEHFVDHRHGAWYRILGADNRKYSDEKSPAGKTDYHTMGACHDTLDALAW